MRLCFVLLATAILCISGCDESDQSTPAFFEVVEFQDGIDADGFAFVDVTVQNTSNGTGKNVHCTVIATMVKNGSLGEEIARVTVLFDAGVPMRSERKSERHVLLYSQEVFESLGSPVVALTFELTWEEVGSQSNELL